MTGTQQQGERVKATVIVDPKLLEKPTHVERGDQLAEDTAATIALPLHGGAPHSRPTSSRNSTREGDQRVAEQPTLVERTERHAPNLAPVVRRLQRAMADSPGSAESIRSVIGAIQAAVDAASLASPRQKEAEQQPAPRSVAGWTRYQVKRNGASSKSDSDGSRARLPNKKESGG